MTFFSRRRPVLYTLVFMLAGCSPYYANVRSTVGPGAVIPADSIAVQYVQYQNVAISKQATRALFGVIEKCENLKPLAPDSLEERLYKKKLSIPEHLTPYIMQDLYTKIGIRYLLVSQLENWEHVNQQSNLSETTVALFLYDLREQNLAWSCSGSKAGAPPSTLFDRSDEIEVEFGGLIKHLLSQWPNFCTTARKN